ncbi:MAG TPA: transposase [Ktedonobacterales bacterium]|nr:transposase [Ktedonobacterales bacterium]
MKHGQISQEQIIGILHLADQGEQTVAAICRAQGITETTFYRWRKKYGDLTVSEAVRLRELERENTRLKRLLAERDLELDATKELLTKKR